MAIKRKIIETMIVSMEPSSTSFTDVLNSILNTTHDENKGKPVSVQKIKETDEYFRGFVDTTNQSGIPPKSNPKTHTFEALPINEDDGEGLGYSNVFVFDKETNVLMYEFNKNGCYLSLFHRCITSIYHEKNDDTIQLDFSPVLRPDAYNRMLNLGVYKRLDLKIATPTRNLQDFYDENDAIGASVKEARELGTDTIEISYDIKGKPIHGMPSRYISKIINRVQSLIDKSEEKVFEKFSISGYYQDPEDDKVKKDAIDFILDRYEKSFKVDEPKVLSDPQTREKSTSLFEVYLECKKDFEMLKSRKE